MKEIKRFDLFDLTQKFGLDIESEDFVFKPQETSLNHYSEPHRSEMYSFGIILKGAAQLKVGLENYNVQAPGLVVVSPDEIRQWVHWQDSLTIISIFFTENFVVSGLSDTLFLKRLRLFKRKGSHFIPLNPEELTSMQTLFDEIEKKKTSGSLGKNIIVQALLRALLLEAEGLQQIQTPTDSDKYSQAYQLTDKFKELLSKEFSKQREVSYYADRLFVTSKHLSQILKDQTGKTASELIEEIVCLEAKVLLQVNELNVSEIADQLNFANPSFFSKFFKRYSGISPIEYRRSLS
jgi:AraC-type DNA-binding domain-containing proteins